MERSEIIRQIKSKKSCLCVGLDTDPAKIPHHLRNEIDPVFAFNRAIIDATHDLAVAYKPNLAFYEALGPAGWESFQKTVEYIGKETFTIADAKRGDIGNTAKMYARTFFEVYGTDAVTVAPYMGRDSVEPFLGFSGKWAIILGLTSNKGADDFQFLPDQTGTALHENVIRKSAEWGSDENTMFVIGATRPEMFKNVRRLAPRHFLLVPGVGAQGGSVADVMANGMNEDIGLLVNASRGIIYAGPGEAFANDARKAAMTLQQEMAAFI